MDISPRLTVEFVRSSIAQTKWDLTNQVLYDLCEKYPLHDEDRVIIAKICLIGRSYAAAIERHQKKDVARGDEFYEKNVVQGILKGKIDDWFRKLKGDLENKNDCLTLEVHKKLTDLFEKITDLKKRSLASKYLHFHFPTRYFIYDARASVALSAITDRRSNIPLIDNYDKDYASFFYRCKELQKHLCKLIGRELTPRELDKCFLAWERKKEAVGGTPTAASETLALPDT